MKGCLIGLGWLAAWGAIFLVNLGAMLVFAAAESLLWRWLALTAAAVAGGVTLLCGRYTGFAQAITLLSQSPWSASYETNYRQTTGIYPTALVTAVLTLLLVLAGAIALLVTG